MLSRGQQRATVPSEVGSPSPACMAGPIDESFVYSPTLPSHHDRRSPLNVTRDLLTMPSPYREACHSSSRSLQASKTKMIIIK